MNITKDFESKRWDKYDVGGYSDTQVDELLSHTRALEAMLKKHEFSSSRWNNGGSEAICPECSGVSTKPGYQGHGHKPYCRLAKLLADVK